VKTIVVRKSLGRKTVPVQVRSQVPIKLFWRFILTPKFKHNCNRCVYLKTTEHLGETFDLYVCPYEEDEKSISTVVARYDNDGPEYISGVLLAKYPDRNRADVLALNEALTLALERGFYLDPKMR